MGKVYEQLDDSLIGFIGRQHVFFVGTAPSSPEGHLNLSPKGLDTFRILGPNSVAYLDLTGSGIETVAHLRENGRLTIMFCAWRADQRLYVAPPYRGRGTGRLLVEEVVRRAERVGYRRMVLDTLPEMAGALALYRRHGFVETARYWNNPIERTMFLEKQFSARRG